MYLTVILYVVFVALWVGLTSLSWALNKCWQFPSAHQRDKGYIAALWLIGINNNEICTGRKLNELELGS